MSKNLINMIKLVAIALLVTGGCASSAQAPTNISNSILTLSGVAAQANTEKEKISSTTLEVRAATGADINYVVSNSADFNYKKHNSKEFKAQWKDFVKGNCVRTAEDAVKIADAIMKTLLGENYSHGQPLSVTEDRKNNAWYINTRFPDDGIEYVGGASFIVISKADGRVLALGFN